MPLVNNQRLAELQKNAHNIRNLCIMAHVDHGKTTLADSLVASNGIISHRLVGKLRYMDSRKDEQERGITMKSSSISLYHKVNNEEYLINLIDSPGHVDFSSEVSTGVRLCDGAIIVVDVVEGVCAQTKVVLRQAWLEHIKPVLVLNKIDRLITELKFQPLDAYIRMAQVLEQVNAQVGELFAMEVLSKAEGNSDWSSGLEEADDSNIYFAPEQGNVVFASAADGWGFRVQDFAGLFASKLGVDENILGQSLWGDYFYNAKTKSILPGAQAKAKKPLFVQVVLEHLWAVYDAIVVRKDKLMLEKIVEKLNLKISPRDMKHSDPKVQVQAVLCQWLPLSEAVLKMVCEKLPSPLTVSEARAEKLMCSQSKTFDSLPEDSQQLKKYFMSCSSEANAPVIVFVSKMILVERQSLPQFKPRPLTAEDIAQRREQVRKRHAELLEQQARESGLQQESTTASADENASGNEIQEPEHVFIAFARVFSGTLRKGQELYVLGPKYDPSIPLDTDVDFNLTLKDLKSGQHVTRCSVGDLYLLMGRELEELESVPAGNVVGIGGLEDHILKSATLSSTLRCPAFTELTEMAVPIVRVAVEPSRPSEMHALVRGLKLLNQADPCVQVVLQETGEHVLITAGEVHLQRCLQDLKERYAHVEVNASPPIVPFRETIVPFTEGMEGHESPVEIQTPNKRCMMKIRAIPLPTEVTTFLEKNSHLLKTTVKASSKSLEVSLDGLALNDSTPAIKTSGHVEQFKQELEKIFNIAGPQWANIVDSIISFGPRRCGPNILVNKSSLALPNFWTTNAIADASLQEFVSSFINGFQLATLAGPICEEPLMGVGFIVEECSVLPAETETANQPYGPFSGQIISSVKEGCRRAFQNQQQRLMAAMYSCSIQVSGEVVGKMYGVISKRHGRIVEGDLTEGSASFSVTAYLPVIESFDLANEIRKQTSGQASHQLVFSHWEVIDTDPFWVPTTEEELELYGDKGDSVNRAQVYMNAVRRRKGLPVLEKVVEFAEKQRTLSRKV